MDRFKFRAWHKIEKTMIEIDMINFEGKIVLGNKFLSGGYGQKFDDIVLMQCTGLKDKNGKLIYEGDFVKRDNNSVKHLVKYFRGAFEPICYYMDNTYEICGNIHNKECTNI